MGLDMYLEGRTFNWSNHEFPELDPSRDGFPIKGVILRLGYWRKHPDLHGYIVQNFADGKDGCQDIELGDECIEKIIAAIKARELPHTEGFFFGESDGSEDEESIEIFQKALDWMRGNSPNESRSVVYRASW